MPRYVIIDDTDPGLVYTGNWRVLTDPVNPRAPDYNGTMHATNDPTATVSYNFTGTMVSVFRILDTPNGYPNASFTVSPDAVPLIHLNQTGSIQYGGDSWTKIQKIGFDHVSRTCPAPFPHLSRAFQFKNAGRVRDG